VSERGRIEGLPSAHPMAVQLPPLLQESDDPLRPDRPAFIVRFLSALDDQIAPVFSTLDNIDAYFDPSLTPSDFLDWLAGWIGIVFDESWSIDRRRTVLRTAIELYRWRGTRRGLAGEIELATGVAPEIEETGGISTSMSPETEFSERAPALVVRLRVPDPSAIDRAQLEQLVETSKPAFAAARVEVTAG
jgi:phage tail-like protein